MSISQSEDMKSKCDISHIFWTNYIFGKIKTLCYINFKNWYNNCTIIFPKKSFVQEILEAWHFDFRLITWRMTLLSVFRCEKCLVPNNIMGDLNCCLPMAIKIITIIKITWYVWTPNFWATWLTSLLNSSLRDHPYIM